MFDSTLFSARANPVRSILSYLCLFAAIPLVVKADVNGDGKTIICFVGHKTSHGFGAHEYSAGNHLIEEWLAAKYPDAKIEGRHAIPWPENEEEFFKDADGVVFFCSGGGGHVVNKHVPEFDKVMRTGAGLACLHYGVEVPIGPSAKGMLAWMGGYFEAHWSVNPHWVAEFESFSDHPAAKGIKPFKIDDEWYFHMRFVEGMKGVEPILSAVAPDETMKRGDGPHSGNPAVRKAVAEKKPQHVAWAYQRGENYNNGRGYGFTGLHYHWNWEDDNFRKTVLNGVAWSVGLEIPENGIETETPTREFLEENAQKWGGDQGRKKKAEPKKPTAKVDPNLKPLFHSKVVNTKTPGHAVAIDVELPKDSKELHLVIADGGDGYSCDWADWAEPRFVLADGSEKKLTDLDWKRASTGWGQVRKGQNAGGRELKIAGETVAYGIGAHANSIISYDVPKGAKRFKARGGLDNGGSEQQNGGATSVQFLVYNADPAPSLAKSNEYVKKSSAGGRDASEALDTLTVHPDLEAQLFASEDMITSPSSIDIDAKGRVWVCDVVNYRRNLGKRPDGDQILILEDTDGDAKADKKTVFYQGHDVDSAHGICVLGDRVIISCGDDVFSLYDRDGDGKADEGSKELMFTKIGGKQHDHGIHAFHFGPDGRLYFNYGNAGKQLCDPEGNLITDINGVKCTNQNNLPYQEGMVFRCDLDGKNVEMLGWNFRNNWEIAVDSFGTVWQSDNDDDGNKGVRINYVMEYGNYGYKDEITGAGWRDPRPGMSEEIPLRHFHQNDPGVVPNLLQTGAGSPTGICVYEGDLLPEIFRGQMIHCDAGPNVARAYPVKPYGAGYQAEVVDILTNTADRWFRPSDACVAPDGSLFIADWYDPGVGGHGMGDIEKGRIYRVIPKGKSRNYMELQHSKRRPNLSADRDEYSAALTILESCSPNTASRFEAWTRMRSESRAYPDVTDRVIETMYQDASDPRKKARIAWLGNQFLTEKRRSNFIENVLGDDDPDLRITALRATRQTNPDGVLDAIETLATDSDPRVRRECAIALRFLDGEKADQLWAQLAKQYDGKDRWYLEALGIGADLHWDDRLSALEGKPHPNLIWRSRGSNSAREIATLLATNKDLDSGFVRAIHFQKDPEAQASAYATLFNTGGDESALFAASKLGPGKINELPGGPDRLESLLEPVRGKAEFVALADRLNLRGFDAELADYIAKNPNTGEAVTAAKLLLRDRDNLGKLLRDRGDIPRASAIIGALGKTGDRSIGGLLASQLKREDVAAPLKPDIVNAMAMNGNSGRELLKLAQEGQLEDSLKPIAALAIARSPDAGLRNDGAKILPVPKAAGAENFPPLAELVKMSGNAKKGAENYTKAACVTCHKVKGEGIDFGPDLTEIGNKLGKDAMFESILYPNSAISHGFHGVSVTKKDGAALVGYITGETDTEVQFRLPGGVQQNIPKKEIAKRDELPQSLMPPGLAAVIGVEGLADLVAYLQSLK